MWSESSSRKAFAVLVCIAWKVDLANSDASTMFDAFLRVRVLVRVRSNCLISERLRAKNLRRLTAE